jgi:hypothetical protein
MCLWNIYVYIYIYTHIYLFIFKRNICYIVFWAIKTSHINIVILTLTNALAYLIDLKASVKSFMEHTRAYDIASLKGKGYRQNCWRHDSQYNNAQHNNTQNYESSITRVRITTLSITTLSIATLSRATLSITKVTIKTA